MDKQHLRWLYDSRYRTYERFTDKLKTLLIDLLAKGSIPFVYVNGRTKNFESLFEKMRTKNLAGLDDVHDVCGLRVVTLYENDVPRIEDLLRREFDVIEREDTAGRLEPDQFGYRSIHLIVRLRENPALDWADFKGLPAEIQLRTELQDVWAQTGHEIAYKFDEVISKDKGLQRRLSRLGAAVEGLDGDIVGLRRDWRLFVEPLIDHLVSEVGSTPNRESRKRLITLAERAYSSRPRELAERQTRTELVRDHRDLYSYLEFHFAKRPALVGNKRIELMRRDISGKGLVIPVAEIHVGDVRLGNLSVRPVRRDESWAKSEYIRDQMVLGREVKDCLVFEARRIGIEGAYAKIDGGITTYASALIAQDALEAELMMEASDCFTPGDNAQQFSALMTRLQRRSDLERSLRGDLLSGAKQYNALAISTLLVLPDADGEYRVVYQRRSAKTASHAGLFHVIPAAMFQPAVAFPDPLSGPESAALENAAPEWNWERNVIREYGEELFNEDLSVDNTRAGSHMMPRTEALRGALNDGKAVLRATGLVVSLLNLRPEICTVLLIKDLAWWEEQEKSLKPNWEYQLDPMEPGQSRRSLKDFRLGKFEDEFLELCGATAAMWVPPGLAALWLGVEAARQELSE